MQYKPPTFTYKIVVNAFTAVVLPPWGRGGALLHTVFSQQWRLGSLTPSELHPLIFVTNSLEIYTYLVYA